MTENTKTLNKLNPTAQADVTDAVREELDFLISNMFDNHEDFFNLERGEIDQEEFDDYVSGLVANGLKQALGNN